MDKIVVVLVFALIMVVLGAVARAYKISTNSEFRNRLNKIKFLGDKINNVFKSVNYSFEEDNIDELLTFDTAQSLANSALNINKAEKLFKQNQFYEANKTELIGLINIAFNKISVKEKEMILSRFKSDNVDFIKSKIYEIEKFKEEYFTKYNYNEILNSFLVDIYGSRLNECFESEIKLNEDIALKQIIEIVKSKNITTKFELQSIIDKIKIDDEFGTYLKTLFNENILVVNQYLTLIIQKELISKAYDKNKIQLDKFIEFWKFENIIN